MDQIFKLIISSGFTSYHPEVFFSSVALLKAKRVQNIFSKTLQHSKLNISFHESNTLNLQVGKNCKRIFLDYSHS